jgi:HEAT repeat protein
MTEWLREGIEGRSLKATLRLYLLGLMVLAPAAAVLALIFGGQASFVTTPLLVLILVASEYVISYGARLRKGVGEPISRVRLLVENSRRISLAKISSDMLDEGDASLRASVASVAAALEAIGDGRFCELLDETLQDMEPSVRIPASKALLEIGDRRIVNHLISALDDKEASVRSSAREALLRTCLLAEQVILTRRRLDEALRMETTDESEETLKNDLSRLDKPGRKGHERILVLHRVLERPQASASQAAFDPMAHSCVLTNIEAVFG